MTPEDDDRALSQAFADLRREEEARMPAFDAVVRRGRARPSPRLHPARSLGLAAAAALVALGVWLGVRAREPRPAVPPLAEWRSPTDFLLATPGRDLLAPAEWGRSVLDLRDVPPASHPERRSPS